MAGAAPRQDDETRVARGGGRYRPAAVRGVAYASSAQAMLSRASSADDAAGPKVPAV